MKNFLIKLQTVPEKGIDIVLSLMDGLKAKVSSANGALVFIVLLVALGDIFFKGSIGFVAELIKQLKGVIATLPKDGWFLISVILFVFVVKKKGV